MFSLTTNIQPDRFMVVNFVLLDGESKYQTKYHIIILCLYTSAATIVD